MKYLWGKYDGLFNSLINCKNMFMQFGDYNYMICK